MILSLVRSIMHFGGYEESRTRLPSRRPVVPPDRMDQLC